MVVDEVEDVSEGIQVDMVEEEEEEEGEAMNEVAMMVDVGNQDLLAF